MSAKENITNMDWANPPKTGDSRRFEMIGKTFNDSVVFPNPLEYEDIDREFVKFCKEQIQIVDEKTGELFPLYVLFSNQRFTEFLQTWQHTDEENNLLMNFMTVTRANNPSFGESQGKHYNIPGNRNYTIGIKEVLEDNGNESYEVYSMKQPYAVNITYRLSFMVGKFSKINEINLKMNDLFKSLQCYISPNGYYLPMKLDNVNDDTQYSIEDRKFFIQSFDITILAYIISKKDFEIKKYPKRNLTVLGFDDSSYKPSVGVLENENGITDITIDFKQIKNKCEFMFDEQFNISNIDFDNIRYCSIKINGNEVLSILPKQNKIESNLVFNPDDDILIKIKRIDEKLSSSLIFKS